jgi:hypothetical protein
LAAQRPNRSQKKQGIHGIVLAYFPPEEEAEDDDDDRLTKKYALKVSVELTEIP